MSFLRRAAVACIVAASTLLSLNTALAEKAEFSKDWFWGEAEQRAKHDAMVGQPLPDLVVSDWINGELTKEDLKGKIVVVDVWATWCGPCLAAMPKNTKLYETYKDQGVQFVGICGSQGQEKMAEAAKQSGGGFPMARDHSGKMAEALNVMWWPTYVIADREGKIRAAGLSSAYVEDAIKELLEESPGTGNYEKGGAAKAEVKEIVKSADAAMAEVDFLEGDASKRANLDTLQGKAAPDFDLGGVAGAQKLSDLKGKVVVLDFWATWCGPCIASVPKNNEISAKYGEKDVVFIGVCHPKGVEKMDATVKEHNFQYPVLADSEGTIIDAYNVNSYPDYYVIGKDGTLLFADVQNSRVPDAIEAALAK